MVSYQQVRRNILHSLPTPRLQFSSEVFVFGEITSWANALSQGPELKAVQLLVHAFLWERVE